MASSIVQHYLECTRQLATEYGESTIVLMQVGSFYEMYGLRSPNDDGLKGSRIEDVAKHCDLLIANKAQRITPKYPLECVEHVVCMAGFGLPQLSKYVRRLQSVQYTVGIYVQREKMPGEFERVLKEIVSPGTYIEPDSRATTNIMASVVVHGLQGRVTSASVATFDMVTGANKVEGFDNTVEIGRSVLDDVDRVLSVAAPKEVLLSSLDFNKQFLHKLTPTIGLSAIKHHIVASDSEEVLKAKVKCAQRQLYQRDVLVRCYDGLTGDAVAGWMREVGGDLSALVLLLDFVGEHNPDLLLQLSHPEVGHREGILRMANHSLSQLNILACGRGRLSSVTDMVDCSVTPMGSRLVHERLARPLTRPDDIKQRLSFAKEWQSSSAWESLRKGLEGIGDIMRIHRLAAVGKLRVNHLARLDDYVVKTTSLTKLWKSSVLVSRYPHLSASLAKLNSEVLGSIDARKCAQVGEAATDKFLKIPTTDVMFFKNGVDAACDEAAQRVGGCNMEIRRVKDMCELILARNGEKRSKKLQIVAKGLCTIVEKDGPYVSSTKRRLAMIVEGASKTGDEERFFGACQVSLLPGSKSSFVLTSPYLAELRAKAWSSQKELVDSVINQWKCLVSKLATLGSEMRAVSDFVSESDVIQNTCYVAKKYCHVEPVILEGGKSSVELKGVRHPLVEAINRDEVYVANDIALGRENDVVLLYGTNAVGKSSLIKSIGISVCLAQAGMYVPCGSMELCPYDSLYTRILGNDDLFRGLSTFAVEMSELRTILMEGTERSLIIGDELCSGTETSSATSIFAAAIEMLHNQRCSSIFATHFHEIVHYAEVCSLQRLSVAHMAVVYDEALDQLVYDRRIRPGPGNNMYGLEVCKALSLPDNLLKRAHQLRKTHCHGAHNAFELRGSKYNKRKMRTACENCGAKCTEVHHLMHRAGSSEGRVGQTSLNHCANLLNLCDQCHSGFHASGLEHRKAKTISGETAILGA